MIQSGHNFAHVMAAQLSWLVKLWPDVITICHRCILLIWNLDYELIDPLWNGFLTHLDSLSLLILDMKDTIFHYTFYICVFKRFNDHFMVVFYEDQTQ